MSLIYNLSAISLLIMGIFISLGLVGGTGEQVINAILLIAYIVIILTLFYKSGKENIGVNYDSREIRVLDKFGGFNLFIYILITMIIVKKKVTFTFGWSSELAFTLLIIGVGLVLTYFIYLFNRRGSVSDKFINSSIRSNLRTLSSLVTFMTMVKVEHEDLYIDMNETIDSVIITNLNKILTGELPINSKDGKVAVDSLIEYLIG